jgi:hypothetical protein
MLIDDHVVDDSRPVQVHRADGPMCNQPFTILIM